MTWKIFNDTVIGDPLRHPFSCFDTVKGECSRGLTSNQCMELCKKSDGCHAGMYIKANSKTPSWCLDFDIDHNPSHQLSNRHKFDVTKGSSVVTKTFIDTKHFKYPADNANTLFFLDRVELVDAQSHLVLSQLPGQKDDPHPYLHFSTRNGGSESDIVPLHLLQQNPSRMAESIEFGEHLAIAVYFSNLIIGMTDSIKDGTNVDLEPRVKWQLEDKAVVQFIDPKNPKRKDKIAYGDKFIIRYLDRYEFAVNKKTKRPIWIDTKKQSSSKQSFNNLFMLRQSGSGNYCTNRKCKQVLFSKCLPHQRYALRYNKHKVFKTPQECEGICTITGTGDDGTGDDTTSPSSPVPSSPVPFILLIVIVVVIILISIFVFRKEWDLLSEMVHDVLN